MKRIFSTALVAAFLCLKISAQVPSPSIPLTGNIGAGGIFPLFNAGPLIFSSDASRTMAYPEMSAFVIKVVSSVTLTATRNLIAPNGYYPFAIENATTGGQSIQLIGATGTGVTIPNCSVSPTTCTAFVFGDGTNYYSVGSSAGGSMVYPGAGIGNSTGSAWGTSYSSTNTIPANFLASIPYSQLTGSVPTWNQSTTGNAATATALAATPSQCTGSQFATGVAANGAANCGTPTGSGTVNSGTAFSPAYYPATGTAVSGTTPFTGLGFFSALAPPAVATNAQVVAAIGTIPNSSLTGSGITLVSGVPCSPGGSCAPPLVCAGSASPCFLQQINPQAGAASTTTTSAITTTTTSIPVASCAGFTFAPGAIVAVSLISQTEYMAASSCSGTTLTVSARGFWNNGSTTNGSIPATAWGSGAIVVQVVSASSTSATVAPYAFQLANGAMGFINTSNTAANTVSTGGLWSFFGGLAAGGAVTLEGGSGTSMYTGQAIFSNLSFGSCGTMGGLYTAPSGNFPWFAGGTGAGCTVSTNLVPPGAFVFTPGTTSANPTIASHPAGWITQGGVINAAAGYQIAGAAPNAHCLIGNGTDYVDSATCGGGITTPTTGDPLMSTATSGTVTTSTRIAAFLGFGDSYMYGAGSTNVNIFSFYDILANSIHAPKMFNYGISGLVTPYIAELVFGNMTYDPSLPTVVVNDGGLNDANLDTCGRTAGTNCVKNYQLSMEALEAQESIPPTFRIFASAATATGTTALDTTIPLASNPAGVAYGTARHATSSGATFTFSIPTLTSPTVGLIYPITNGATAPFGVAADGISETDYCSGTTTFSTGPCGGQALPSSQTTVAPFRQEFPLGTGTTTTITAGSVTSGVATFTASNSHTAGQQVILTGFTGTGAVLNGNVVTVLSSGLSGSQYEANVSPTTIASTGVGSDVFHTLVVTTLSATSVPIIAVDWIPPSSVVNVSPVFMISSPPNSGFPGAAVYTTAAQTITNQLHTDGLPVAFVNLTTDNGGIGNLTPNFSTSDTSLCPWTSTLVNHPNNCLHAAIAQTVIFDSTQFGYPVFAYNGGGLPASTSGVLNSPLRVATNGLAAPTYLQATNFMNASPAFGIGGANNSAIQYTNPTTTYYMFNNTQPFGVFGFMIDASSNKPWSGEFVSMCSGGLSTGDFAMCGGGFYDNSGLAGASHWTNTWGISDNLGYDAFNGVDARLLGTVASAATIAPTTELTTITGSTTITTITPPKPFSSTFGGCLQFLAPTGTTITFGTGGNIAKPVSVVGPSLDTACYSGTLWQIGGASAAGMATLAAGTATVTNAAACTPGAACVYKLTNCGLNSSIAVGVPSIGTVTAGTSFVINSYTAAAALAVDSSLVCWQIN